MKIDNGTDSVVPTFNYLVNKLYISNDDSSNCVIDLLDFSVKYYSDGETFITENNIMSPYEIL